MCLISSARFWRWNALFPDFPSLSTGNRIVKIILKESLPCFMTIFGFECCVWYREQPSQCFVCQDFGHWAQSCPLSGLCRCCRRPGHKARECTQAWYAPSEVKSRSSINLFVVVPEELQYNTEYKRVFDAVRVTVRKIPRAKVMNMKETDLRKLIRDTVKKNNIRITESLLEEDLFKCLDRLKKHWRTRSKWTFCPRDHLSDFAVLICETLKFLMCLSRRNICVALNREC